MTPAVGQIVHVAVDPNEYSGADVAPAIITRVWSDDCINVHVMPDSSVTHWYTSVSLQPDRAAADAWQAKQREALVAAGHSGKLLPRVAYWPTRAD